MSAAETIYERAKTLPAELQAEALHYLDYLALRRQAEMEDRGWAQFSAVQFLAQYSHEDAIYDKEQPLWRFDSAMSCRRPWRFRVIVGPEFGE